MERVSIDRFLEESKSGTLLDIRTPAEYRQGHIGGALNFPLFTDEERVVVGTLYKQSGRETAILKGLEFVGPRMAKLARNARKIAAGKPLYLYCWRGGMRSGSVAWLLHTVGMRVYVLEGGYKAYRQSFRDRLAAKMWQFIVIGGLTGCGKTELLEAMTTQGAQVLDLEGLAQHRGSAFGGLGLPVQPSNEQMSNYIYDTLRTFDPAQPIWAEGESYSIGKVSLLREFYDALVASPFVYFSRSVDERIERILDEYGGFSQDDLIASFKKIEKRIGFDRLKVAVEAVEQGDLASAVQIALDYYDKGYDQAISNKRTICGTYDATGETMAESATRILAQFSSLRL